jgi:hypothetical protein
VGGWVGGEGEPKTVRNIYACSGVLSWSENTWNSIHQYIYFLMYFENFRDCRRLLWDSFAFPNKGFWIELLCSDKAKSVKCVCVCVCVRAFAESLQNGCIIYWCRNLVWMSQEGDCVCLCSILYTVSFWFQIFWN